MRTGLLRFPHGCPSFKCSKVPDCLRAWCVLLMSGPEDGISEDGGECRVFEQVRVMSHEDVNVPGLVVFIGPDDGMIAHFGLCIWVIGIFVHAGQHMNIWARRFVPSVPLFLFHEKR